MNPKMTCVASKPAARERLQGDLAIARIQWRRNFGVGLIDDGSRLSAHIDHLVAALGEKTKADTNA